MTLFSDIAKKIGHKSNRGCISRAIFSTGHCAGLCEGLHILGDLSHR